MYLFRNSFRNWKKLLILLFFLRQHLTFTLTFFLRYLIIDCQIFSWLYSIVNRSSYLSLPYYFKMSLLRYFVYIRKDTFQCLVLFFEVHSTQLKDLYFLLFAGSLASLLDDYHFIFRGEQVQDLLSSKCFNLELQSMILSELHCEI